MKLTNHRRRVLEHYTKGQDKTDEDNSDVGAVRTLQSLPEKKGNRPIIEIDQ